MDRKKKNHKRYCIAFGCHNNTKALPNLSLFKLPKDPQRMREWLRILGREDLLHREDLKPSSYEVCCFHFDESSIKVIKLLKADAMPARVALDLTRDTESKGSVSSVAVQTGVLEQSFQTRKAQPSMKEKVMETSMESRVNELSK
ncbi:uncharacterized protein LOC105387753 [Plutella xylostella]|uniref:uncharacterized protein LOC105387753 n=1 Tax=Plutella xylostella TaxID=51655 RepID=UPI002032E924|nr:uncharacterized protein LOC105387753 [Plutella xylostella]